MKSHINPKSFKKRKQGNYCAQVIITLDDGHHITYAVRTVDDHFDKENIYVFNNGKWQLTKPDEATLQALIAPIIAYARVLGDHCKRKMSDKNGDYWQPYCDCHLACDDDSYHLLKIGNCLVYANQPRGWGTPYELTYTNLSDVANKVDAKPVDTDNAKLMQRINKQLAFGHQKVQRMIDSRPVGYAAGMTWDMVNDHRHAMSSKDYRKFRNSFSK
ncbi:hypothetical protein [Psychrobacter sp. I-STPA10]|uniref:hypothetical protein n=1 Tax=Psychrobacter sp. I-STPA10 TaxID=2585769 RepID=UPI001E529E58|nr:hypothetical protein [Psychrobacter sp. I-STPA10]